MNIIKKTKTLISKVMENSSEMVIGGYLLFLAGIYLILDELGLTDNWYVNLIGFISLIPAYIYIVYLISWFIKRKKEKSIDKYREYLLQELEKNEHKDLSIDTEVNTDDKSIDDTDADKVVGTKRTGEKDIIAQMFDNNNEIKEYFRISKSQAKSSFWFSVIACIVGVFMLGLAIYGAIVVSNLQIAIIGTISGAITEVISGTVLWVHNQSALQLNHYYDALHQNEKFLSAINVADKLSDEKREEMYIEIIRKQIETHAIEKETHDMKKTEVIE